MKSFLEHTGLVAPLDQPNIDTDQIIPKQFLKRTERTGFGQFLFYDWRYLSSGDINPSFALNNPRYEGATILVAGKNFGCGSSHEHAPWALMDYGFRSIIAASFANIFYNNCIKNGLLPVTLADAEVALIARRAQEVPGYQLTVDLKEREVKDALGFSASFEIDDFRRTCSMEGLDEIGLTLRHEAEISLYEARRPRWLPASL
ncbi:MAG TPA: 3-isopropylmalate dehydratase small subunit [Pyrinomonadaceae bacterium]|jgi:3-isopropylmalate/(R)-2-methylmalate dehydratase small subunit